jgi:P4 family phage/plasmid primase-like protien
MRLDFRKADSLKDLLHGDGGESFTPPTVQPTNRDTSARRDARDGTAGTHPLSELGNAQRLAEIHGEHLRFVPETGAWLVWRDGAWHWSADGAAVTALAAKLPEVIYAEGGRHLKEAEHFTRWARASQTAKTIANAVSLLAVNHELRAPLSSIDADPWLCGIDGGRKVVELRTCRVRAAKPGDLVTKSLNVSRVGEANAAVRWQQFLAQVFQGNEALIDWLQRWCGYMLTGLTREQVMLFGFGHGSNGKSVAINTLLYVMGQYGMTVASETLAESKRGAGAASPDLAGLVGARLVVSAETDDGMVLAEGLVKSLVAGDAMSVRPLYRAPFDFTPQFKLLATGNHRPIIKGTDHGIWRRMRLVPFNRKFEGSEKDDQLGDKLRAEAPHILAWMLEGCAEWQAKTLRDVPDIVVEQTQQYRTEMDVIGQWIAERCVARAELKSPSGELYDSYKGWALDNGFKPRTSPQFGRHLDERGFDAAKSGSKRYRLGLGLASVNP